MKKSKMGVLSVALPLSLGLSLALSACGGSDSDGNGNGGGTSSGGTKSNSGGTKSNAGGTDSSSAGTSSKAGSGGSGNSTSNPDNGTDIPGDTPLSDLTDDQVDQLCNDFSERFSGSEFDDTACRMGGVFSAILAKSDAEAQQLCKTAYDECKASPPETNETCDKPSAECTATVDELNACLDDSTKAFGDLGDALPSCDTLKLSDIAALFTQFGSVMDPASCATYQEKCPDGPQAPSGGAMP